MMSTLFRTPFDAPFDALTREMDRAFERPAHSTARRWPGLNAWRDGDEFVVEAEIPGFREEDIAVFAHADTLTIRGERAGELPEHAKPLRMERVTKRFERELRLPQEIDPERVSATLKDGVLRVALPLAEHVKPRRIEVHADKALPSPQDN
ncbi:MAG: Hsp20/alpha crystallin family protein [Phycisphaerales bacterium]